MRCTHYQRFFSYKANYEIFCLVVVYLTTCAISFSNALLVSIEFATCRFYKERHRRIDHKEISPLLFYQQCASLPPSISQKSFFHRYINRSKISDKIPLFHSFHGFHGFHGLPSKISCRIESTKQCKYKITTAR